MQKRRLCRRNRARRFGCAPRPAVALALRAFKRRTGTVGSATGGATERKCALVGRLPLSAR
eukprot:136563-Chlamydomonas_euryale.AAC.1